MFDTISFIQFIILLTLHFDTIIGAYFRVILIIFTKHDLLQPLTIFIDTLIINCIHIINYIHYSINTCMAWDQDDAALY